MLYFFVMAPSKIRKRRRSKKNKDTVGVYAEDVRWCLYNKESLKFTAFADHFALTDKQFAYNRYSTILKKHIKDKDLEADFKLWKKCERAEDYWTKKIHRSTVKKSRRKATQHIQKSIMNEYSQLDKYLEREYNNAE